MSISLELEAGKLGTQQPTSTLSSKINDLPQELMNQIFSYLSKYDLQNLACVNWSMYSRVKAAANLNEPSSIKNFIKILCERLNVETFSAEREKLIEISENIASENFANLILLKRYILDVKAGLINVIKTLNPETANDLRNHLQFPHFLEDIFELATFERRIDRANRNPNEFERWLALRDISNALTQAGNIERAIEVANSIFDYIVRGQALHGISKALAQPSNIVRAIEIAKSIPNKYLRENALQNIFEALTQADNIDKTIEAAIYIPDYIPDENMTEYEFYSMKGYVFYNISKALAQSGNIVRAISLAIAAPIPASWRESAFRDISETLTQPGNIGRAIVIATWIYDERLRRAMLRHIFEDLAQAGVDRAIEYIES